MIMGTILVGERSYGKTFKLLQVSIKEISALKAKNKELEEVIEAFSESSHYLCIQKYALIEALEDTTHLLGNFNNSIEFSETDSAQILENKALITKYRG